ncbi:MAG: imelysin family protein [Micropepsaceae bacterium]
MPELKTRLLLGAGALALTPILTLWRDMPVGTAAASPLILTVDGEEGGEGGEGGGESGGGVPASYVLGSTDPTKWQYDATAVIDAYVAGGRAQYLAATAEAAKLEAAITAMLDSPSAETLAAARAAWVAARPSYLVTEAFRFYDGPIEDVEGQLNSWPMNEAYIDYTKDDPKSGIINDPASSVDAAALAGLNQKADEADVTTGWHAIEFLLWGQDFSATGPGDRPASDFVPGTPETDKRRAYLKAVTELLITDLQSVTTAWDPAAADGYVARLKAMPQREVIGRMINGIAILAGSEMRSERMAVALDSGDQEDEQSCFSDTTRQDFVYDLKGVENVWYGTYPNGTGSGLDTLVRSLDPALAAEIDAAFADASVKIKALGDPWDQVLAAPPESPERRQAEDAVEALGVLAAALKKTGPVLGVLVQIPGI